MSKDLLTVTHRSNAENKIPNETLKNLDNKSRKTAELREIRAIKPLIRCRFLCDFYTFTMTNEANDNLPERRREETRNSFVKNSCNHIHSILSSLFLHDTQ